MCGKEQKRLEAIRLASLRIQQKVHQEREENKKVEEEQAMRNEENEKKVKQAIAMAQRRVQIKQIQSTAQQKFDKTGVFKTNNNPNKHNNNNDQQITKSPNIENTQNKTENDTNSETLKNGKTKRKRTYLINRTNHLKTLLEVSFQQIYL